MSEPIWCVMPVMAGPEMTEASIADLLGQSIPTKILIINQAVETPFRERLERLAEEYADRLLVWSHMPPLPSLSATWNRALDFVWQTGADHAFVVNNDVRLHASTVLVLVHVLEGTSALFVSAVGVTKEQFDPVSPLPPLWTGEHVNAQTGVSTDLGLLGKGGPDFSCFLIAKACHDRFRFDERLIPCFTEDVDYHRRLMLTGEGHRIFSINLPYLHLASQTLQLLPPERAERIKAQIEQVSRAYYQRKWAGPVNHETRYVPFEDQLHAIENATEWKLRELGVGPTTPELQAYVQRAGS